MVLDLEYFEYFKFIGKIIFIVKIGVLEVNFFYKISKFLIIWFIRFS